ncbi:hypothetical protein ACODG7_15585 [Vibrio anguillarum]|uniref:hypothetical protein n=1 Tax=Vibrio anguillarum TaxID=55601 RepID=UPI000305FC03|nr:hypothetical protein [Vibrio anguillarum]OEE32800.1 hypothetical protein A1QW_02105 [Vibrio anguillarum]
MCSSENKAIPIIDVYWKGPISLSELKDVEQPESQMLYQVYGHHPVYGSDSLLYIGKTEQIKGVMGRVPEHKWIDSQCDDCKIYYASCGEFKDWQTWESSEEYPKYDSSKTGIGLKHIESLLIYAHHPSGNSQSIQSLGTNINKHFRIFNTGKRKALERELSTQYFDAVGSKKTAKAF